jgi:RES domain-containing protein
MEVFRITHRKWSGKLIASGLQARWNSSGIRIIYSAESRALACLENVVRRGSSDLRAPFITMVISIPDDLFIQELPAKELPENWHKGGESGYFWCRPFGDKWIRDAGSAILKVPSAVVHGDSNYLLNPDHPDFQRVSIVSEEPFLFDDRITNR